MPNIIKITDIAAPELDVFARLTEAQLRNRLEPEKGVFIAESPKVIGRALDAGYEPVSLLMEPRHIDGQGRDIIARCEGIPVYTASREILEGLTGYALTRGVLCAMRRPPLPSVEDVCANARRVAVLEGIVDSTNVGAIFRSAAALNIDAVLVTPTCGDPLYRRAVRVSMGTVFQVPWTRIGSEPSEWPEPGLERLRKKRPSQGMSPRNGILSSIDLRSSVIRPPITTVAPFAIVMSVSIERVLKNGCSIGAS